VGVTLKNAPTLPVLWYSLPCFRRHGTHTSVQLSVMGFLHRTHFRVSVMKYLLNVPYQALDGAEVSLNQMYWQAALTGRIAHFQVSMETLCITLCPTVITEGALHANSASTPFSLTYCLSSMARFFATPGSNPL